MVQVRLTYNDNMGGYGVDTDLRDGLDIIHALARRLGQYEDVGTVEEFKGLKMASKLWEAENV